MLLLDYPGRTHRSNQVTAPEYVFLISELAGEQRFASIVAKRLESLVRLFQKSDPSFEKPQLRLLFLKTWCSYKGVSSQGALTHGDRRATETRDLSRFNFDNKVMVVFVWKLMLWCLFHKWPVEEGFLPSHVLLLTVLLSDRWPLSDIARKHC